jgi:hypothetical protein
MGVLTERDDSFESNYIGDHCQYKWDELFQAAIPKAMHTPSGRHLRAPDRHPRRRTFLVVGSIRKQPQQLQRNGSTAAVAISPKLALKRMIQTEAPANFCFPTAALTTQISPEAVGFMLSPATPALFAFHE